MAARQQRQDRDVLDDSALYEGVDDGSETAARRELLEHLVEAGADLEQLREAVRDGRLATLPIEFALKGQERYTLTEVARKARLEPAYVRAVVLSLGHANPPPRQRTFTNEDVETARLLRRFL